MHLRPKQELVFKESSEQVAIIVDGAVVSLFITEDGKQKTSEMLIPGDVFHTEMNYMLALTEAKLCLCPMEVFKTFYLQCPDFTQSILTSYSSRFRRSMNYLLQLQNAASEEKVRIVLEFLKNAGVDSSSLTHENLALLSDLNRVTVTRAIKSITHDDQVLPSPIMKEELVEK
jgi:CRP-like cAMP-binding protein